MSTWDQKDTAAVLGADDDSGGLFTYRSSSTTAMGSLCSRPSTHSGGHTVLSSSFDTNTESTSADPRTAAARAAEERLKAVSFFLAF